MDPQLPGGTMGTAKGAAERINLLHLVDLLQGQVTPEVCRATFGTVRTTERQRAWTLEALVRFWTAVILRAPAALTQALNDALEEREPLFPRVQARFAALVVLDGSRLAAIAHRLKLLWADRRVVLPGALLAVYDLGRGLCRTLLFSADAFISELVQAHPAVAGLAADTLVVGDRAYGHPVFFAQLHQQRCWGVIRRHQAVKLQRVVCLGRARGADGELTDWQVRAGTGRSVPPQRLRWIRWRHGRTCHEVLTNVLAPERLAAQEAIALYTARSEEHT